MRYFTKEELIASDTARTNHLDNNPKDQKTWNNLFELVRVILDPARERLGAPIYVSSGYRSQEVNRAVRGQPFSQHTKGQAVDIYCSKGLMKRLLEILKTLPFDQLGIYERKGFFHVSYNPDRTKQRGQVFYGR